MEGSGKPGAARCATMRCVRGSAVSGSNFSQRKQRVSVMLQKNWVSLIGVSTLLIGGLSVFSPPRVAADGSKMFPNTDLTTKDAKTVHFYEDLTKGKIVVTDLMYTPCQYACPLETARMAQV